MGIFSSTAEPCEKCGKVVIVDGGLTEKHNCIPKEFSVRYRMKPRLIEAMQLIKDNRKEVIAFVGEHNTKVKPWDPKNLYIIKTNNDDQVMMQGDYVIKRESGALEVLPKETFETLYEKEGLKNG